MILQDFLICGLIDIGEDDKRLEWLEAAAAAIAKDLLKSKRKLISYTLVALDNDLPETEPVFREVEAVVITHWKALRGKFPETPRQLFRGVILAALEKIGSDEVATSIVWLVGGSFLPRARLTKERPLVEELFKKLGVIAETAAARAWAVVRPGKELKLPAWNLRLGAAKLSELNADWLNQRLGPAAGGGTALEDYPMNPHNPYNHRAQWAQHFATHAAKAIADGLNQILRPVAERATAAVSQLQEPLRTHNAAVNAAVKEAVRQGIEIQVAQERRTALLWWKQTLYSPSRRRGYRNLQPAEMIVLMALDLHKEVPPLTPQSVDFLLRETIREIVPPNLTLSGEQLVQELIADPNALRLSELAGEALAAPGRICLAEYAREVIAKKSDATMFEARVGILASETIGAEDWAVWLFRDFQALRLTA